MKTILNHQLTSNSVTFLIKETGVISAETFYFEELSNTKYMDFTNSLDKSGREYAENLTTKIINNGK